MDTKIASVFEGNFIRNNDGTQLDDGISDGSIWQTRFHSLVILPLQQYDLPRGTTDKLFIRLLLSEIDGVIDRKWNIERPLCYIATILQISPDLSSTPDIRRRLQSRLLDWGKN